MAIGTLLAALLITNFAPVAPAQATKSQATESTSKLYVLTYSQGKAWIPGQPMQKQKLAEHAKYMRSLLNRRVLVAAGPFMQQNGGMAIVRAQDQGAADAILNNDPGITNGTLKGRVLEWLPVFNSAEPLKKNSLLQRY